MTFFIRSNTDGQFSHDATKTLWADAVANLVTAQVRVFIEDRFTWIAPRADSHNHPVFHLIVHIQRKMVIQTAM